MQQEQYMSQVLGAPENYSPLHVLSAVAMGRWLNVSRISIAYMMYARSLFRVKGLLPMHMNTCYDILYISEMSQYIKSLFLHVTNKELPSSLSSMFIIGD